MSTENILSRLEGVRQTGPGRHIAKCPAHDDKHPSFTIRESADGRIWLHCFAGCEKNEILSSLGITFGDLYPHAADFHKPAERRPFSAIDILRCTAFEALICAVSAARIANGGSLSEADKDRLLLAASRLQKAVEVANG